VFFNDSKSIFVEGFLSNFTFNILLGSITNSSKYLLDKLNAVRNNFPNHKLDSKSCFLLRRSIHEYLGCVLNLLLPNLINNASSAF